MRTILVLPIFLTLALAGCEDTQSNGSADMTTAGADLLPACVSNPTTHVELLNACTNAESFAKQPFYPTLAPNGELPGLP